MINLKPYYDAALAADARVKECLAQVDAAFNEGTEEGTQKALELRPALDEARAQAVQANALYTSMRDGAQVTDEAAQLFVSPTDPASESPQGNTPKVMNRAAFEALSPSVQMAFMLDGGKLED